MAWDEAYPIGGGNKVTPTGAGKLKALWDAVRSSAVPDDQPPPPAAAPRMASPLPDMGEDPDNPEVRVRDPQMSDLPADARVRELQGKLDVASKPATLKDRILRALPTVAAAGIGAAFNAPALVQGTSQAADTARQQRNVERQSLQSQVAAEQTERQAEYTAAQRNQQMSNIAAENRQARTLAAKIAGQSRENVADTAGQSRVGVAQIGAGSRESVATTGASAKRDVAKIAADARIRAGKYAADAAANRQSRSIAAGYGKQQAGFTHTDEKPTADEDRRADLAKSLGDIGDEIIDIAQRRPELFGKIAGRSTTLRQAIGTDDPDVAMLKTNREALGQIALGAHAMRNASHIGVAADSIVSAFNNSPEATISAIGAAKKNANTMNTVVRPTLSGKVKPAPGTSPPAPRPSTKGGSKSDPAGLF